MKKLLITLCLVIGMVISLNVFAENPIKTSEEAETYIGKTVKINYRETMLGFLQITQGKVLTIVKKEFLEKTYYFFRIEERENKWVYVGIANIIEIEEVKPKIIKN